MIIHVVIGVAIALLLNVEGLRGKRIYRAIFILPVVIPPIIVATVWRNMFDPQYGAINQLFNGTIGVLFKLPPVTTDWLHQPNPIFAAGPFILPLAYFALLAANVWLGWPLNSVVATGALQSVPKDLYEAAEMDGAGWWAKFKTVTLPFLRPAMLPYAIYGFVITFNLFYLSYFMSGGGPFGQTELLVTTAYRLVAEQHLYGVAAAFAIFQFFILLAITIVTNKLAKATAAANDRPPRGQASHAPSRGGSAMTNPPGRRRRPASPGCAPDAPQAGASFRSAARSCSSSSAWRSPPP